MIRSWPYVVLGTVLAALAAGSLVGLEFAAFMWVASVVEGGAAKGMIAYGLLAAIIASIAFLIGLIFPGIPIWTLLLRRGKTSWRAAALTGMMSAATAGVVLSAPAGWYAWSSALWLLIPGTVAGLIVRLFAYRAVKPPPQPPVRLS